MSVIEVTKVTCKRGRGDEFGERLARGLTSQGEDSTCVRIDLLRSVERPDEYLLEIEWDSVESHHNWRDNGGREDWRGRVGWDIVEGDPDGLKHYTHFATVKEMGPTKTEQTGDN